MNNFENLETLWSQQAVAATAEPQKVRAIQSVADRVVNSRSRLLKWGVAVTVFTIVVTPLLTVVNYLAVNRVPTAVALLHLGVLEVIQIAFLIALLRRISAHRQLRARSAANVRENMQVSLTLIEVEMRDYRFGGRLFGLLVLFDLLPVLNGYVAGHFGGVGALDRAAGVLVVCGGLYAIAVRHYRRVLQPQRDQLSDVVRDLATN